MSQQNDTRLSARNYLETLESVQAQFALIRFALSTLSKNSIKVFFKKRLENQLNAISKSIQVLKVGTEGDETKEWEETEEMMLEFAKKKHRKNFKPSDTRFKIEFSEDRLNQSELLLLVAHFESFMKEIHRTFLIAAPAKVFGKRETKIMLREVFENGFRNELIHKEVKFLDSQRVERRAEYFSEYFGVSFCAQKELEGLKEIMETRNKISHEIYHPVLRTLEQIKSPPLVSDTMLKRARILFRDIPQNCVKAGAKVYQSYFR